jgi:hypothetical protein
MRGFHQPVHWHSNAPLHVICLMVLKRDKTGMSFGWACLMADGGCLAACCGDLQLRPALSWHGCIPCLPARLWLHNKCWDAQSPTSSYLPQFPAVSSPVTPSHRFLFVGSIALGILRLQQYTLFVNNSIALYPASILEHQLAIDTRNARLYLRRSVPPCRIVLGSGCRRRRRSRFRYPTRMRDFGAGQLYDWRSELLCRRSQA